MRSMVVLFALCAVACGSYVPVAQPPHLPAVVLDARGRPLDTAEVINARALHLQAKALDGHYGYAAPAAVVAPVAHSIAVAPAVVAAPAVIAAPAAVSHQSRLDVRTSPAVVSYGAAPLLAHSALGYAGHGHYLHKRSLGHYVAPAAVSHQSRIDVRTSPAIVSHAVAAPVLAHAAPVLAHAAPVVAAVPAAVSHQSRIDVRTSPAIVSHAVAAPVLAHAAPVLAHSAPVVAVAPAAVSHQSRVDVRTSPAVVAHGAIAPYSVGYHGAIAAPLAHNAYSSPLVHGW